MTPSNRSTTDASRRRRGRRRFDAPAPELQPAERYAGQVLDARLHLLDRQVLDRDEVPVQVVDDLELSDVPLGEVIPVGTSAPVIESLLSGPVLGTRMFGGRPPPRRFHRVAWDRIAEIGITVRLGVAGSTLDVTWVERWIRDRIISRIPGGRHDPE